MRRPRKLASRRAGNLAKADRGALLEACGAGGLRVGALARCAETRGGRGGDCGERRGHRSRVGGHRGGGLVGDRLGSGRVRRAAPGRSDRAAARGLPRDGRRGYCASRISCRGVDAGAPSGASAPPPARERAPGRPPSEAPGAHGCACDTSASSTNASRFGSALSGLVLGALVLGFRRRLAGR